MEQPTEMPAMTPPLKRECCSGRGDGVAVGLEPVEFPEVSSSSSNKRCAAVDVHVEGYLELLVDT